MRSEELRRPKVSVLVAAFNQEKYIGRCLRSLLHQSMSQSDYEIIVIDDGSTDRTSYALSLFSDPKASVLKVLTNESNLGLPKSLNRGIECAKGKFIVRVDSDDYVNFNFLQLLSYYLESNDDCVAVGCDYILIDESEGEIAKCDCSKRPIACGIMFSREKLIEIGLYDETFECQEERELRARFEQKYSIERLNLPLYRYRRHGKNMTNDEEKMRYHLQRLVEKHGVR